MTTAASNGEIASLLDRHARLLALAGDSSFRARAFARAAESVRNHAEPVAAIAAKGELQDIPGVGEGIASAIGQLLETGRFDAHEELTRRVPESLLEVTAVPGIGPKTAMRLFAELQVSDLATLNAALSSGRIGSTKGLGSRLESIARDGLDALQRRTGRTLLGIALPLAEQVVAQYESARQQDLISIAGSVRRWDETVGDLDFVIASRDIASSLIALKELPVTSGVRLVADRAARCMVGGHIEADVYFTEPAAWGSTLVRATGSSEHLERLGIIDEASTEETVYARRGLPVIPPELRAGHEEFERWPEIPHLVTIRDIHGEFHTHTTWSDGAASVEDMAFAAIDRGYSVLGITDHSQALGVAGGLTVDRLHEQRKEIAAIQATTGSRLRILAGAEVEVDKDGFLDYTDEVLAGLDVVVASLHSGLRRPRTELSERMDRVLRNVNVDIVAHPSGRLIERREGGDFAWDHVYATAATSGTALEINADPARLDLDPHRAARASAAGCLITINCDAHHPSGFAHMAFGISVARKAWLKPRQILNCWPSDETLNWLRARGETPIASPRSGREQARLRLEANG